MGAEPVLADLQEMLAKLVIIFICCGVSTAAYYFANNARKRGDFITSFMGYCYSISMSLFAFVLIALFWLEEIFRIL